MKIGVVGSINVDQVVFASHIPNKGETIMGSKMQYNNGGKGANQAVAISRLGIDTVMFGKVGDDPNGDMILSRMKEKNLDISNVEVEKETNTGFAVITIGDNDNTIIVIPGANACVNKTYIDKKISEIKECGIIVMQHEIPIETNEYVINVCKENNIKTILNPAPANEISKNVIEKVDYLIPNEHEAKIIFKNMSLEEICEKYPEKVVITLGSKGVMTYVKNKGIVNVPCRKNSKVVDTTGAGDTFNGAFAYAISQNYEIEKALKFANIAAGISIEKVGAQSGMTDLNEIMKEM